MKNALFCFNRQALSAIALCLAFSPCALAQQANGSFSGAVSNASSGAFLEGARVELPALGRETRTDKFGRFTLTELPPGEYDAVATYLGLDTGNLHVRIEAGLRVTRDFELTSDVYKMNAVTVVSEREGNAAAIVQQQLADNIVNVVSLDAYGNVADGNIGNFFQRLPGVAVAKGDGGDANALILQGAPPDLSLVTLDGTRLVSADASGGRAADISLVPAELIKQVEVNKTFTPDMEMDGIGGSANLTTKSAFDFRSSYVHYLAAYSLNTYRSGNPWQPYYTLTAMDKFGRDQKLGVAFSASYNEIVNPLDRVFGQYSQPTDKRDTIARLLDDTLDREKWGAGLKLEYRFNDTASVWFNTLYTHANQTSERYNWDVVGGAAGRIADYSKVSLAAIESGTAARDSLNNTAGVAPGFTDTYTQLLTASLINQPALIGPIETRQVKFDVGARKSWAGFDVQTRATYSHANTTSNSSVVSFTLANIGVAIDTSGGMPAFTQLYGPTTIWAGSDFSKYSTLTYQFQPSQAMEDLSTAQVDLARHFGKGENTLEFKTGAKFSRQDRTFTTNNPRWNYVGADGVAGLNSKTGINDDNQAQFIVGPAYAEFNGRYPAVDKPSVAAVQALFLAHPTYFVRSNATNDISGTPFSEVIEDVGAGYVMATGKIGKRLTLVGGVRYEHTADNSTGTESINGTKGAQLTTTARQGSYGDMFPSLNATYALRPNLLLRGAVSESMARPTIANITPTTTVNASTTGVGGTITQNNVDLKPMFSKNYDLMVDYYLRPAGILSAGVFRKEITNFIATFSTIIPDGPSNGFNGSYPGYTLNTSTNLGTASIEGYELNYYQQLTMLPEPFKGFSVFGNYTHLRTTGSYANGATSLANFVPVTSNAGVSYAHRGLTVQVVYNYKSPYLVTYSPTPALSTYQTVDQTYDLNVQYKLRSWLTPYVDVANIFNHAPSTYSINDTRIYIQQVWGTKLTIGVTGRF